MRLEQGEKTIGLPLEEEGDLCVERGDHLWAGSDFITGSVGKDEGAFQGQAHKEPNDTGSNRHATSQCSSRTFFVGNGFEYEVTATRAAIFVVVEVERCRVKDLAACSDKDKAVTRIGCDREHPFDRDLLAHPEIGSGGDHVDIAGAKQAVDGEPKADVGEVGQAFVEGPFQSEACEDRCAVIDQANTPFDLKAEG